MGTSRISLKMCIVMTEEDQAHYFGNICWLFLFRFRNNRISRIPIDSLRACLQGGRVTPASRLTLAGGSKIARVYKQNFTGRVTLPPGTTKGAW